MVHFYPPPGRRRKFKGPKPLRLRWRAAVAALMATRRFRLLGRERGARRARRQHYVAPLLRWRSGWPAQGTV